MNRLGTLLIISLMTMSTSYGMYTTGRQLLRPRTTARQRSALQRYTTKPQTLPTSQHTVWQRAQETIRNNIPAFVYRWLGWQQPAPIALEKRTPITTEISKPLVISQTDLEKPIEGLKPLFAQFNSLQQIANNLTSLETEAQQQLLTVAKMPKALRNNLMQQEKTLTDYLKTQIFKQSLEETTRDSMLPIELVNDVQKILQLAGLNPNCVSLGYNTNAEEDIFHHDAYKIEGFTLIKDGDGATTSVKPAAIWFNKEVIENLSPEVLYQKLIHAVTHLAESHLEKIQLLQSALGKAQFDMLMSTPEAHIYNAAMERNADLLLGTKNQTIALDTHIGVLNGIFDFIFPSTKATIVPENSNEQSTQSFQFLQYAITCNLHAIDAKFSAQISSFSLLEEILRKRYLTARETLIKKYVIDREAFLSFEKAQINFIENHSFKKAHPDVQRDPLIPQELVKHIEKELLAAGINPHAVSFIIDDIPGTLAAKSPFLGFNASLDDANVAKQKDGLPFSMTISSFYTETPAQILFSSQWIKDVIAKKLPFPLIKFCFMHEIMHIAFHHLVFTTLLGSCNSIRKKDNHWQLNMAENTIAAHMQTTNIRPKELIDLEREMEYQADIGALQRIPTLAEDMKHIFPDISAPPLYLPAAQRVLFCEAIQRCYEQEKKPRNIPTMYE